ncbi:hypothetical protein F4781DRAFT_189784 [Annulohypoxylon bovei var. microspora]|nr:hypothetical protein F4781DRAFT_189784 [Annulohypoxylon bovei var. microspora]
MTQIQHPTFAYLPTELRLQIWEDVLKQETEKRLVVIDLEHGSVYPMKRLISPLLTVNRESRELAKAFYNFVIDVYRKTDSHKRHWLTDHKKYPLGPSAGILHLNVDRDIFVKGPMYFPGGWFGDYPSSAGFKILFNFHTKPMNGKDRDRVQRTLAVGYSSAYSEEYDNTVLIYDYDLIYELSPVSRLKGLPRTRWLFSRATECFKINLGLWYFEEGDIAMDDFERPDLSIRTIIELGGEDVFELPGIKTHMLHFILSQEQLQGTWRKS